MADQYNTAVYGSPLTDTSGGWGAVTATLATLVADGASPTQAHVTALANAIAAVGGAFPICLAVDLSQFQSRSALVAIINQMAQTIVAPIVGA
jgi:hypothetical protein